MPRSHCKIANNQENINNISLIKSMNSVVCTQREYNLDEALKTWDSKNNLKYAMEVKKFRGLEQTLE